ncbi:bifunctional serine/threonine-protein kinase/formylglycine-generating enzyme family protein [Chondromyces crocatus]|uniref:Protein kinase domain-containing protein n=1 Tax=Chondromyces crocatus TaxID=52 RepID=A0A0K1ENL0_CHOCO|nr:bifunctional serine/threonine-protein kinase/formylglycine-generating enzyme family protein [Chondromyces crocatus]AKT42227.1 uncharacterized protein CMC5_064500 [Chondromyces crocatus]
MRDGDPNDATLVTEPSLLPADGSGSGVPVIGSGADVASEGEGRFEVTIPAPSRDAAAFDMDVPVSTGGGALPGRYEDLGFIGRGSFGEVRRVRDTLLERRLAIKLLHAELGALPAIRKRFFTEVQITAQLQHPGIVPVYDHGELADGRLWYAMKEVRGCTLGKLIDELHQASGPEAYGVTASGWTFRRLVDALARIAQAVAYAHGRGVVHRDLKAENLMVGEFGEVLVMDWGLARRIGSGREIEAFAPTRVGADDDRSAHTRHGDVLGTPAYMPLEQARGERERHGPPSDVYALGAILYHLLAGRPPYVGTAGDVLQAILAGPPAPVESAAAGHAPVPLELSRVCARALDREMAARGTAEGFAQDLFAWLDGVQRRERALAVLGEARALGPEIEKLHGAAEAAQHQARVRLAEVRPFDPVETKRPAWQLEDEAAARVREAALAETLWLQRVHGALAIDGELPEAHEVLADHYREALTRAERAHADADAARFEAMLKAHDRGRHAAFLRGDGALTLLTDPPGASVALFRYASQDRRLAPIFVRDLGVTPLREVPVARGSYLLVVRAPGRAEVRYPVLITRDSHWDGVPPGAVEPLPITLPDEAALAPDDVYVPAGWTWTGGDSGASDSLPGRRLWIDAFILRRHPVTTAEYLAFMNDLVACGRDAEARAVCPRAQLGLAETSDAHLAFQRDERGLFSLPPDQKGLSWRPDWPVVLVDWHAAMAYARWFAGVRGGPWRLPDELEREKAARGVDGREFPWGSHADPTFAAVVDASSLEPSRQSVHGHPADESPYGVRGLAGNTRDWCLGTWRYEGPRTEGDRLCIDAAQPDDDDFRAIKGGAWASAMAYSRAAARFGARPDVRRPVIGIRLARSYR